MGCLRQPLAVLEFESTTESLAVDMKPAAPYTYIPRRRQESSGNDFSFDAICHGGYRK